MNTKKIVQVLGGVSLLLFLSLFIVKAVLAKPLSQPLLVITTKQGQAKIEGDDSPKLDVQPILKQTETCGESGFMTILLLGVDSPFGVPPHGADLIRFIEVDFSNQSVKVFAFPRDLWLDTPVLLDLGYQDNHLGLTYYYAQEAAPAGKDPVIVGINALAQTLYDNFEIVPDHYFAIHMDAFAEAIDSIDGIDVNIPANFSGAEFKYTSGQQQLNGKKVLDYSRTFLIGTEWDRFDRQNVILNAMREKILSPEIISDVPGFLSQFDEVITTDLSPQQLVNLTCMIEEVSQDNIDLAEVSPDMVSFEANGMIPDVVQIKAFLRELFDSLGG